MFLWINYLTCFSLICDHVSNVTIDKQGSDSQITKCLWNRMEIHLSSKIMYYEVAMIDTRCTQCAHLKNNTT